MKTSVPLAVKVTAWLLLNLALIAAVAAALLMRPGTWERLLTGPAGDRLQAIAVTITSQIEAGDDEGAETLLTSLSAEYGLTFMLRDRGRALAGPDMILPREVAVELRPPEAPPRPGAPALHEGRPPHRRERPEYEEFRRGRFWVHADEPSSYWMGVRVGPAVLLATSESRWRFLALVNLTALLTGSIAVVAVSVLLWLPPVFLLTRDIRRMTSATEHIAEGRFDTRVDSSRSDEFGRLSLAIDRMAARLEEHAQGQKRFLSDAAHELCSPLSRLRVAVEILETRADPSLAGSVADVQTEVAEIAALVNEILAFSKAGLRRSDLPLETVDLSTLVPRVLARECAEARVAVHVPAGLTARADAELLSRALGNLVRNALRHAGPAANITVQAASSNGGNVTLAVEDDGPGLPSETLHRLGEPFFRPDAARTREDGGTGLGLAIVRSCATACRGQVRFANRIPQGFRAEIVLHAPEITPA